MRDGGGRDSGGGREFRGPRAEWEDEETFEKDGIILQLRKLPLRWPRFSYSIGMAGKDGQQLRFISVETTGKEEVRVDSKADVIAELVARAEEYVRERKQALEDAAATERQDFGGGGGGYHQPRGLSGGPGSGKTARKKGGSRRRGRDDDYGTDRW